MAVAAIKYPPRGLVVKPPVRPPYLRIVSARDNRPPAAAASAPRTNGAAGLNGTSGAGDGVPPMSPIEKLEKLGLRNMTREAREGQLDPVFERSDEMAELSKRLQSGSNALLIGNTGVGKTAIVEGLAQEWKEDESIFFFSLGMKDLDRSVLEPQLKLIVETVREAYRQGKKVYLLMDELHLFEQAGILEILKEPLARPGFQVIGATTTKEFYKFFSNDATKRRFGDPIDIKALDGAGLRRLVRNVIPALLARLNVSELIEVPPRSRQTAIDLSPLVIGRYAPDATIALLKAAFGSKRSQVGDLRRVIQEAPKKLADDLNDLNDYMADPRMAAEVAKIWKSVFAIVSAYIEKEATLAYVTEELARTGKLTITDDDVRTEASKMAGLDLTRMDKLDAQQPAQIEERIRTRFIGQDQAVKAVSGAIKRYKMGRRGKNAPIAAFLFTGPTGIGKTELAHTLAWLLFGDPDKVMTVDMTKCEGRGGKTLLFGPDPGFVGFDQTEGMLPELLKRKENRHGILFFDEADKADREVYESMLVMLDRGYVQNKKTGEKYSLEDIVVILASNQGEAQMLKPAQMQELVDIHFKDRKDALTTGLEADRQQLALFENDADEGPKLRAAIAQKDKQLADMRANQAETRLRILQELIGQNRQVAVNSFKTQKDEFGREKYTPPFLNRLEIVPFDYLTEEDISRIADIMLKNFVAQVERDQKLEIILGETEAEYQAVKQLVLSRGTDLVNGARPLKRAIENYLDNPFSAWMANTFPSGEYIIKVSVRDGQFVFEETKQKSEKGKQADIAHIHGRRGVVLRRLMELAAGGTTVEESAIKAILAPPKGRDKMELWFEEHPFPEGEEPAKKAALDAARGTLVAEDLDLLRRDLFSLLRSQNRGILALALSLAAEVKPLREKRHLQALAAHEDPFIARLAQAAAAKIEEATEYNSPTGQFLIDPGNKDKVDPKAGAFIAGVEEFLRGKEVDKSNIEALRRAVGTMVYIAKDRQEKEDNEAKRILPLKIDWEIDEQGTTKVVVSNSDATVRVEEQRLKDFMKRYIENTSRTLQAVTTISGTTITFTMPGKRLSSNLEISTLTACPLNRSLDRILDFVTHRAAGKAAQINELLIAAADFMVNQALPETKAAEIRKAVADHITKVNPEVSSLEEILSCPAWDDSHRNEIIGTVLSMAGVAAVPKIGLTADLEGQELDLRIFVNASVPQAEIEKFLKRDPAAKLIKALKATPQIVLPASKNDRTILSFKIQLGD